jgi:hypothetical protein
MDHLVSGNAVATCIRPRSPGDHVSARRSESVLQSDFGVEQMREFHDPHEHREEKNECQGQFNGGLTVMTLQNSCAVLEMCLWNRDSSRQFHRAILQIKTEVLATLQPRD